MLDVIDNALRAPSAGPWEFPVRASPMKCAGCRITAITATIVPLMVSARECADISTRVINCSYPTVIYELSSLIPLTQSLEESRLSMSATLGASLVSGSVDASLAEVDRRSQHLDQSPSDDLAVGPFSVLNFRPGSRETSQNCRLDNSGQGPTFHSETLAATPATTTAMAEMPAAGPASPLAHSMGWLHG